MGNGYYLDCRRKFTENDGIGESPTQIPACVSCASGPASRTLHNLLDSSIHFLQEVPGNSLISGEIPVESRFQLCGRFSVELDSLSHRAIAWRSVACALRSTGRSWPCRYPTARYATLSPPPKMLRHHHQRFHRGYPKASQPAPLGPQPEAPEPSSEDRQLLQS